MPYSTTIGDYSNPSTPTATSEGNGDSVTAEAVFGDAKDQTIENFTTYASQAAADADWIPQNVTYGRVNITDDDLDFQSSRGTTNGNTSVIFDLGSNLSDTKWILRFKVSLSSITAASLSSQETFIGLYSADGATGGGSNQDFIGIGWYYDTTTQDLRAGYQDNNTCQFGIEANGIAFSESITTTDYWLEISRDGTTVTYKLYSDAYSTLLETETRTISGTVSALRYVGIKNIETGSHVTGGYVGICDDFEVWDGISENPPTQADDNATDNDTSSYWISQQETNPAIYVDCGGSAINIGACALHLTKSRITETQIKIRGSTDTTFTDSENLRTIDLTELSDGWNYLRFNVANFRYLQIYGSSGSSAVLAISEIKYETYTDAEIAANHGHLEIDGDTTGLANNGT